MADVPRVVMCSMWRNDAARNLDERVKHLLSKSYPRLRWLWLVGDSDDATIMRLLSYAAREPRVTLAQYDTGIAGTDFASRLARLSAMTNEWFRRVRVDDDFVLTHESDLLSPADVVERMVAHAAAGRECVAGWPVIALSKREQFYDLWAFRAKGWHFEAFPPHHPVYRPNEPFEVDSFGSVCLFPAGSVRGGIIGLREAVVGVCEHLRRQGLRLWVAPRRRIEQRGGLGNPWVA